MADMNQSQTDANVVEEIIADYKQVSGSRGTWETHWQEIAERVFPAHKDTFYAGNLIGRTPGSKQNQQLFDSTAAIGLSRFTAILTSLLTPDNAVWHRIRASDRDLMRDYDVKVWFDIVNQILWDKRRAPTANFAGQNIQVYQSLGAFGTGSIFIESDNQNYGLRYRALPLSQTYFRENAQGQVDTMIRAYRVTARQFMQRWKMTAPDEVKTKSEDKNGKEKEYLIIHCIKPQTDYEPGRLDYRGRKWVSHYVCHDTKTLLETNGYRSFPVPVGRYEQAPGEIYGRSPAMMVLPSIKTLNEQKKTILKQGHRIVDPVLLAHDDGVMSGFSLRPGALNYGAVNPDGRPLVHALPAGNIAAGQEMMDAEAKIVNDAFLVNLFQILVETPRMTATEVLERTREKGILLAPTVGRQQSEYLGPMVERELDVLSSMGIIPPMPDLLREAEGDYRIEYENPISRAARAEETSGLNLSLQQTLEYASQTGDLEPLDWYDMNEIVPAINEINGVPARWLRSLQKVLAIRDQRAQQQATQEQIQAAPAVAAVMKADAAQTKANQ